VTAAVHDLIRLFDALSDTEKEEALAELLRRGLPGAADLSERDLTAAADDLFRQLDAEEDRDARP
jgi:hypothetical protein